MPRWIHADDLNQEELAPYWKLNENQLRHYFEPSREGIFIAETANVIERAMEAGYQMLSMLIDEKQIDRYRNIIDKIDKADKTDKIDRIEQTDRNIPIYAAETETLYQITGINLTRGILAAFRRQPLADALDMVRDMKRIVILDDVENPTNTGAIFRSAAALSMDGVLLAPGCADALQRRCIRVSMGTVFQIPWTRIGDRAGREKDRLWPGQGIQKLREEGFTVVAMALRHDTVPIDDPQLIRKEKLAIIMGNEGYGLPEETIRLCDYTVRIPMKPGVDSLNVAAASAVAFWALAGRR